MINHLSRLLSSTSLCHPQLFPFLSKLSSTHGLLLNHSLQITKHPSPLSFSLTSLSSIKPNSTILSLSVSKCLTSHFFINSTLAQNNKFTSLLNTFQSLDPTKDQDIIKTIKIVLQLIVNQNTKDFELHQYAKYLDGYDSSSYHHMTVENIESINSERLLSIILNSQQKLDQIALEFNRKFPFVTPQQFLRKYVLVRSRVLKLNDQMVLAPIIDFINHSFTPNCQVSGKYVMNNSFIMLNSTKSIQPGEQLFINYGQLSNNELFFKYNFVVKPNMRSYMMARLNYEEVEEYAGVMYEKKKNLLEKLGGIPEVVKVFREKIDEKGMAALRLYFMDQKDLHEIEGGVTEERVRRKVSDGNQERVLRFLIGNLNTMYRFMKDVEHENENIEYIQMEEVMIVKDFLDWAEKELKEIKGRME